MVKEVIDKFTLGRQPCTMFRHSGNHPARRCQECPDAVKWCEACGQDHHGWGWQTCHTGLGSPITNEPPDDETLQEAVAAVESVLGRAWHEQYDRMLRWFERLHRPGEIDEHRRDEYYAFFLICYHLKDWLKTDPVVQQRVLNMGRKVEGFVNATLSLRLCADLANGVKHFVVTKRIRIDADAGLSVVPVAFEAEAFQEDAFQVTGAVVAKAADQRWDAEAVAGRCVADWQRFLRDVGLLDELSRPAL
jgi:hypothetical protein